MHAVPATPGWIVIIATIFILGLLVRLASGNRGVFLILVLGIGLMFMTYGARQTRQPPPVVVATEVALARPVSVAKPSRSKRPAKGAPIAPEIPPAPNTAAPDAEPPIAESSAATIAQKAASATTNDTPEAPITLYRGSSSVGSPVEKLPGWVTELADARVGSTSIAVSSDRFASINDAEAELWQKAKDFVAGDLRLRVPEAGFWPPSTVLLKQRALIVERCVERTTIEVGPFAEPMYRVHWKLSLSNDLRTSVADAWRSTVQTDRLKGVTLGFLCATGAFAFLNIILRSVAARLAARKAPATSQVA